ncbi:glycoside hydrolase family 28 protein, partial [candidate division KSB1 bacterium]|nr:glycoside hydrolase family 28 protein [candidate division KSB1 bacterium]
MIKRPGLLIIALIALAQMVIASEYNIMDYGAVENENSTQAIQKAVDRCHNAGGGTVLIPAGKFITGTITLKSYVNLHL